MTSCVVYHGMQVLGCEIKSHMWPNVRSTCLCVYVKPMSYFKFTHIMFILTMPMMPSLRPCHAYVNELLYANFVYVKLG